MNETFRKVTAEEVCDWMNAFIQTTGKGKQPAPSDIAEWINKNFQRMPYEQPNKTAIDCLNEIAKLNGCNAWNELEGKFTYLQCNIFIIEAMTMYAQQFQPNISDVKPNINKDFAQRLLLVRDALVNKDFDEAYHQLYGIASPNYDDYFPWAELEKIAEYKQKEDNK